MGSIVYSCVVEAQQKYASQLAIWCTTLVELAGVPASDLYVHLIEGEDYGSLASDLRARGIAFGTLQRFGDGRYCNKIAQLRNPELRAGSHVVLCDTDIAFCGPVGTSILGPTIAARPVDFPNPALAILTTLYERSGIAHRPGTMRCAHLDDLTLDNNCNGGFYVLPTGILDELSVRWEKWAGWTLEQAELLGPGIVHADQVSFGLALCEIGAPLTLLPATINVPTHLPVDCYAADMEAPLVLHYHDRLGSDGLLLPPGVPAIDRRVGLVNEAISARRSGAGLLDWARVPANGGI